MLSTCPEPPFRRALAAPTVRAMGRSPRIEVPDGYYHVHTRGNDRQDIYFGNWSGRLFLRELERATARANEPLVRRSLQELVDRGRRLPLRGDPLRPPQSTEGWVGPR